MSESVSPLAPKSFPDLPPIAGVQLATCAAGISSADREDLFLASLAEGTTVAATFTTSKCPSAPVEWCRRIFSEGNRTARAVVCNSGNANAFTGAAGTASATLTAQTVAAELGVDVDRVYLASTGVIGEPMPDDLLSSSLPGLVDNLDVADAAAWADAAAAIRTTDTFPKGSAARIESTAAHIAGIAKGSGMIAPDMATMLAFVFTDLAVAPEILQDCLSKSVAASFNRITVDSDTSTSDTVLLFATGEQIDDEISSPQDYRLDDFQTALDSVLLDLAHQIVRDGEGATKFVQVAVTGAQSDDSAHRIARSIADSPLVSTAVAAQDANWGRIVMAVGKAGERADRDLLSIWIGDELVASGGGPHPGYSEARATQHLQQDEIDLRVDVGIGTGSATVWTCDLTHGYIEINAGYRS
ncbi:MAG: bifunctional glutamate N-acetyltransferase/amino-acid acetyltransferase ArgJ [Acidimicrobiaceae bacterium]|nr:bifunctional glutamate N-acetyltransferase/amino-acid acetyltransferase ArgJ [Acidimicrobiia bacterium]MCY4493931.1 bifunctional glutamate N-acetyltransferase/amino-acid acetyltransferase ArgJ [Acidimicrobiaceae bacterium]